MIRFNALLKIRPLLIATLLLTIIFSAVAHGAVEDYLGTYWGVFNGNYEERWHALIRESGEVIFVSSFYDDRIFENLTFDSGTLRVDEDGYISGVTDILEWRIEATIFLSSMASTIEGTYENDSSNGPLMGMLAPIDPNMVGNYSGSLTTDDSNTTEDYIGTWNITIDPLGYVSGTMAFTEGDTFNFQGVAMSDEYNPLVFIVYGVSGVGLTGSYFAEYEDQNLISGWWCDTITGEHGSLIGQRDPGQPATDSETDTNTASDTDTHSNTDTGSDTDDDDDNNDDGDSAGCFIKALRF